jgi:hypothetical protein
MSTGHIMTTDLSTALKNAALAYKNKAAGCDAAIAELETELNSASGYNRYPGGADVAVAKIQAFRDEKANWLLMAQHANEGYFWVDQLAPGTTKARIMYPQLYSECVQQGRVRYAPRAGR